MLLEKHVSLRHREQSLETQNEWRWDRNLLCVRYDSFFFFFGVRMGTSGQLSKPVQQFNKFTPSWGVEARRARKHGLDQFAKKKKIWTGITRIVATQGERLLVSSGTPHGPIRRSKQAKSLDGHIVRRPSILALLFAAAWLLACDLTSLNLGFLIRKWEITTPSYKIAIKIK